ncbi:MAG: lactate racemase domain-containing protein [Bacillota bacterium]
MIKEFTVKIEGAENLTFPRMVPVRQKFNTQRVDSIPVAVRQEFSKPEVIRDLKPGAKVAVAVGSRGIANLKEIVKAVVEELKGLGTQPFIVPGMASHGGATAEGQEEVLASFGITAAEMGVPLIASMDVVELGTVDGCPLFFDKVAFESDAVVMINRIKPHTSFKGPVESGLLKMLVIGLGNHKGATAIHSMGFDRFRELIPKAGTLILGKIPPAVGVAVLENAYDETAKIVAVPGAAIPSREPELLAEAKSFMPRLLMESIDVLIVDEIGKDISGSGMDPNITGRVASGLKEGFNAPPIQKILVLGLTERTHGSAVGIGMADVTTRKLVSNINFSYTYANSITSTVVGAAKIPMFLNTEKEALLVAVKTCNRVKPEQAKIVRIKNTLELNHILVSEPYLAELAGREDIEILGEPFPLEFDNQGDILGPSGSRHW